VKPTIVLIQPATNIFDRGKKLPTLPLSLLSAARYLPPRFDLTLVDLRTDKGWRDTLRTELRQRPVLVAITSITGNQLLSALEAVRFTRTESDTPVVWGGIHGTLYPDQVLAEPSVDFVVRNEGEEVFRDLTESLAEGKSPYEIPGLSFRQDGKARHNPTGPFLDLDQLPEVPYEVAPGKPYFITEGRPTLYFETSRGCFSRCAYCYNSEYHQHTWRSQSAKTVLRRIASIRERYPEITHLSLVDDNYFGNANRVREIAHGLLEMSSPITYQIQGAHVQVLTGMSEADLKLLAQSGCVRLDMGVESGSDRILASIGKKVDLAGVRELNRRLAIHNIRPWFNFMAGFPDETESDLDLTRDLALSLIEDNPATLISPIYRVVPYPGTELFKKAEALGFRAPQTIDSWRDFHSGGVPIPWQDPKRNDMLARLYFLSIFVDQKLEVYDTHPLYRFLARIYRPIAKLRLRNKWLSWMPEHRLFTRLFDVS
jgi:radical SAM superfamily enzyme YgiQ (UPF0313 family)